MSRNYLECRGPTCDAPIIMAEMQPSLTSHPVNARSIGDPKGTIAVWPDPATASLPEDMRLWHGRYLSKRAPLRDGEQPAVTHYSTCADAEWFRARR